MRSRDEIRASVKPTAETITAQLVPLEWRSFKDPTVRQCFDNSVAQIRCSVRCLQTVWVQP